MTNTEEGVHAAAARLVDSFSRHDVNAYFSAFTEDASFVFHNLDRVLTSRDAYRAEWQLWEARDRFRVLGCRSSDQRVQMAGEVAVFTHTVETDISMNDEAINSRERETIVFRWQSGVWLAFHEHLSMSPRLSISKNA